VMASGEDLVMASGEDLVMASGEDPVMASGEDPALDREGLGHPVHVGRRHRRRLGHVGLGLVVLRLQNSSLGSIRNLRATKRVSICVLFYT
jgi:hypothetical protein